MHQTLLLIFIAVMQIPIGGMVGYLLVLYSKKPAIPASAPSLPAANLAPSIFGSANVECTLCHRVVARFNADGVCANCAPPK